MSLKNIYRLVTARLFVNTSAGFADGVPNAMLQAWLHEVPVASLNHDPNGWIAEHGLGFCANGDEGALGEWIAKALQDEKRLGDMGRQCRDFAEREFSQPETIDYYLRLFEGTHL